MLLCPFSLARRRKQRVETESVCESESRRRGKCWPYPPSQPATPARSNGSKATDKSPCEWALHAAAPQQQASRLSTPFSHELQGTSRHQHTSQTFCMHARAPQQAYRQEAAESDSKNPALKQQAGSPLALACKHSTSSSTRKKRSLFFL